MIQNWHAKRVTVMGLGRFGGGVGVTRWLARAGARLTLTDKLPAAELGDSLAQFDGLEINYRLGGHDERDFRETDLVVINPAVPDTSPFLQAAVSAGVPLTTEINLFVERCRARCVGVTGSVGKSTVTAMVGHVLREGIEGSRDQGIRGSRDLGIDSEGSCSAFDASGGGRRVWVGGNIGRSLLEVLEEIRTEDIVVLELSSFQLQRTPLVAWSPHIAVLTNISPNHLDWHGNFAGYLAAKLNIVRFQDPARDAVVIGDDPELQRHFDRLFGDLSGVWRYGLHGDDPIAVCQSTAAVDCDDRRLRWPDTRLAVPGRHNRLNAAAALTVAHLLGIEPQRSRAALATFEALPDRLQRVGEIDGVTYYNDSKSTTPTAAATAMQAIDGPLLMILGGYDKGSDFGEFARAAAIRLKYAACIGQTGKQIAELIRTAGGQAEYCGDLASAVSACRAQAAAGDTVLLSPACASWDQFKDYRARGAAFSRLIRGGAD
ncbi:MAG: UDP-N-acetylmuramoyl-L-alanine--D-glutamate ligase [Phycisphaerae bacterium]|nr:UDP-N-acetylmuramoyl-L-alanine--D-glutamate ligase [Phycisphaerae bacterium]